MVQWSSWSTKYQFSLKASTTYTRTHTPTHYCSLLLPPPSPHAHLVWVRVRSIASAVESSEVVVVSILVICQGLLLVEHRERQEHAQAGHYTPYTAIVEQCTVHILGTNGTWSSLKTGSCRSHSRSSSLCTVRRECVHHGRPSCRPDTRQLADLFVPNMCHKRTKLAVACNPVTEVYSNTINPITLSIMTW